MKYIDKKEEYIPIVQGWLDSSKDYNSDDNVRKYLRYVYSGCCAYCQCQPEIGSYFNVEHFYDIDSYVDKPNKDHPLSKDIRNLHYSCERCNKLKMNQSADLILSPNYYLLDSNGKCEEWRKYRPEEISFWLYYEGPYIFPYKSNKAIKTINTFDLNARIQNGRRSRASLVSDRKKVLSVAAQKLQDIWSLVAGKDGDAYAAQISLLEARPIMTQIEQLLEMMLDDAPYSTMIIDNFGEPLLRLIEILEYKIRR